jgi:class 3 adenylate cyclase
LVYNVVTTVGVVLPLNHRYIGFASLGLMPSNTISPLSAIESRLRYLLPADLYAHAWIDPSPATLTRVFEHLRTLHRVLQDYVPREVVADPPKPGEVRFEWQDGTLMFTDLAGFTPLMEANAARGRAGAENLLQVLNAYFADMLEIISKGNGNLLEFTGDAMLAVFPAGEGGGKGGRRRDVSQAVRAGLRMQRAMGRFARIETPHGDLSLGMRIGLHTGRFLTADLGTPRRMEHVLLGGAVQETKRAEGAGRVGRVCLTDTAWALAGEAFRSEGLGDGYRLVVDDLSAEALGDYELAPVQRRSTTTVMLERSVPGLVAEIERAVVTMEPLASFVPLPVLNLIVESAARRRISPDFAMPTVMFVNLIGLAEAVDRAAPGEERDLVAAFTRVVALINAAIEARGGVLKKITCHLSGYDMMIYFGVPNAHTDDPLRAVLAAQAVRAAITGLTAPVVGGQPLELICKIGLARGPVFSAEIGEPRGRREFNILSDTVNTAARLMGRAEPGQILLTETVYREVAAQTSCTALGPIALKGKAAPTPIYVLDAVSGP